MKRRPKITIMWGRVIASLLSYILLPILLPVTIIASICENILIAWGQFRHWIITKLDIKRTNRHE